MILRRLFPIMAVASSCIIIPVTTDAALAAASSTRTWAIAPSAHTSPTQNNDLSAVSCPSPTACVAVGTFNNGTNDQTLVEMWNGITWAIAPSANTSPTQNNALNAVSCPSPTTCVAVGYSYNGAHYRTLIETWDGTAWTITPSPDTSGTLNDILNGVSCTSTSACVAVGRYESDTNEQTLIETWDGTAWSIAVSPNASTTLPNVLESVSCTSPTACVSVGYYSDGSNDQTLVATWDGTAWSITPSPNPSTTQFNFLEGVSCTTPTRCVAVGGYGPKGEYLTLVEAWDGTAWTVMVSPNVPATQSDRLNGVSCTSLKSCVAVGSYSDSSTDQTLVETWDGTAWSITPSPNPSISQHNYLAGVSCASQTACVAAGVSSNGTNDRTLVLSAMSPGGYRLVASDGGVFAYGDATFYGSAAGIQLNKPVVGMAATPDGNGYWLVASDGGVFSYGDATFYGSTGAIHLNEPVVGMAATRDGNGYWLVASDGGVFSYGDAAFYGSMGGSVLDKPIVGMAATQDGNGYWLVASDGGVFAYGDAMFSGSAGGQTLVKPVVGMAASPIRTGYWLVASDGGIFSYGDATFLGSTGDQALMGPMVGMAADQSGNGYWQASSNGGVFTFGDAAVLGNQAGLTLNHAIVGIAS